MPNIGLSWVDMERIKGRVDVVFHVAAIVNFSAALDKAVITNVGGTAAVLAIAKEMLNLQALVYVSTAYCNCTVDGFIEEKVYQSRWDPMELLREVMESPSEEINRRTKEFLIDHPNTYSFTKQLAENLIAQECGDLPIAIVRPSIGENGERDFSLEDKEGRGHTSSLDDDVLLALVEKTPRTSVRELAGKLSLRRSIVDDHLKAIGKVKRHANWVPLTLNNRHKN
ncbi:unnamed protein product [Nezara viridula]|uniref:Fatty acyl-CoA reductase n=1 Tax=Nezara viridula TaxID=85310 RepID=A0A9P0H7T9_NEZVI|nr:unnamed protein product [Nezara viridula]